MALKKKLTQNNAYIYLHTVLLKPAQLHSTCHKTVEIKSPPSWLLHVPARTCVPHLQQTWQTITHYVLSYN